MSSVVFDSSAVLALLHHEPGEHLVWELAPNAFLSSVNAAEVHGKLMNEGFERGDAWEAVAGSVKTIVPFDADQAEITGSLAPPTRSLGDRACLALGRTLQLPVYTADRSWKKLRMAVDVRLPPVLLPMTLTSQALGSETPFKDSQRPLIDTITTKFSTRELEPVDGGTE